MNLPGRKWRGTARALAIALNLEVTGNSELQRLITEVRRLKPDLEERGILLTFTRSNGRKFITIEKVMSEPSQTSLSGRIWHDPSSPVPRNAKRIARDRMAATRQARYARLLERFRMLPKPWGPGSATELATALGEWYGPAVSRSAPAASLGRILPQIAEELATMGIEVEITTDPQQNVSTYAVRKSTEAAYV